MRNLKILRYLLFVVLLVIIVLVNVPSIVAADDENKPVLLVTKVTGDSIHLSWPLSESNIDCNVDHLTHFQRWELYQKVAGEDKLVFNTSSLIETSTIISNLKPNSGYFFYIKLVWDSSHIDDRYISMNEQKYVSHVIYVETVNQGETKFFLETKDLTTDSTNVESTPGMYLYLILIVFPLIILVKKIAFIS